MTTRVSVRPIRPEDFPRVVRLLARAFEDDPWFDFVVAGGRRRQARLRAWFERGLRASHPQGETYVTEDFSGAALWNPPSPPRRARWGEVDLRRSLRRISSPGRAGRVRYGIDSVIRGGRREPHMVLRVIGVDADRRGEHLASALIRPVLERCDREGMPVSLMCTKARNVPLYEHFGFRVVRRYRPAEGAAPAWDMWRAPAAPAGR